MKNRYEVRGEVTVVHVRCTSTKTWHECQIDTSDLPTLLQKNSTWYAQLARKSKTKRYVQAKFWNRDKQRTTTVLMHRFICGQCPGRELHHHDNDGLNNRRENLSQVTHIVNMRERNPSKNWAELDRRRTIATVYRAERDVARKIQAEFGLTRQGIFRIRNGRSRRSKVSRAYLDACDAAGCRTLEQLKLASTATGKFGVIRAHGVPSL